MVRGRISGSSAFLGHRFSVRIGKPVGVLTGFKSEADWSGYRLENDPRLLKPIEAARKSARAGKVTRLEDLDW